MRSYSNLFFQILTWRSTDVSKCAVRGRNSVSVSLQQIWDQMKSDRTHSWTKDVSLLVKCQLMKPHSQKSHWIYFGWTTNLQRRLTDVFHSEKLMLGLCLQCFALFTPYVNTNLLCVSCDHLYLDFIYVNKWTDHKTFTSVHVSI